MSQASLFRRGLTCAAVCFLLWLAWQALNGALRQARRCQTLGQKVETGLQIACGLFSALTALTAFRPRRWVRAFRIAWSASLAASAGLSAFVWGPPMPWVGALFTGLGLLAAWVVLRILRQ